MRIHDRLLTVLALAIVSLGATPTWAQTTTDADRITATARVDVVNAYSFRGLRQDDTGVILWPQVRVDARVYAGDGPLSRVTLYARSWNSLHSGVAGSDGPSGDRWYESDASAGLMLTLARGVNVGATYTAYTSPNDMFSTVKEVSFTLGLDDGAAPGRLFHPYALLAFELDTTPGRGQADGGFEAGRYLEVGVAPALSMNRFEISVPVKVGLSLDGYYELAGRDRRFGFASAAGMVRLPLGGRTSLGAWDVRGGVEYQQLGAMTKVLSGGDSSIAIGTIGVGWSR